MWTEQIKNLNWEKKQQNDPVTIITNSLKSWGLEDTRKQTKNSQVCIAFTWKSWDWSWAWEEAGWGEGDFSSLLVSLCSSLLVIVNKLY